MTIVPGEWERVPVTSARHTSRLSVLDVALLALGVASVVIGVALLARGQALGVAALIFGAGYFARSFADHMRHRRRHGT